MDILSYVYTITGRPFLRKGTEQQEGGRGWREGGRGWREGGLECRTRAIARQSGR
jgi:hypothetical protein